MTNGSGKSDENQDNIQSSNTKSNEHNAPEIETQQDTVEAEPETRQKKKTSSDDHLSSLNDPTKQAHPAEDIEKEEETGESVHEEGERQMNLNEQGPSQKKKNVSASDDKQSSSNVSNAQAMSAEDIEEDKETGEIVHEENPQNDQKASGKPEASQKKRKLSLSDDNSSDINVPKRAALSTEKIEEEETHELDPQVALQIESTADDKSAGNSDFKPESTAHAMNIKPVYADDDVITLSDDEEDERIVRTSHQGNEEVVVPVSPTGSNTNTNNAVDTSDSSEEPFLITDEWEAKLDSHCDALIKFRTEETIRHVNEFKDDISDSTNGEIHQEAMEFVQRKIDQFRNTESFIGNIRLKRYLMLLEGMKRNEECSIAAVFLSSFPESLDLQFMEKQVVGQEFWPVSEKSGTSSSLSKKVQEVIIIDEDDRDVIVLDDDDVVEDDKEAVAKTGNETSKSDGEKRELKRSNYVLEEEDSNSLLDMCRSFCRLLAKGDEDKLKMLEKERLEHLEKFKLEIQQKTCLQILETATNFVIKRIRELLESPDEQDNSLFEEYLQFPNRFETVIYAVRICYVQSQNEFEEFAFVEKAAFGTSRPKPSSQ